jgi:protein involved in sex pheromone biosynthesis
MDEDEEVEITSFGTTEVTTLPVGLDYAEGRARSDFIADRIDVDMFERELDRIARKRAQPPAYTHHP